MTGIKLSNGLTLVSTEYRAVVKRELMRLKKALNDAITNIDKRLSLKLLEVDQNINGLFRNSSFKVFTASALESLNTKKLIGHGLGTAYLVGAFEVYMWCDMMNKAPGLFKNDRDIMLQKATATAALLTATADVIATSIKVVAGKTTAFCYAKISFGMLGGVVSLFNAVNVGGKAMEDMKNGNMAAGLMGLTSATLHLSSGTALTMAGLSYHTAWAERMLSKKLMEKMALRVGMQAAFDVVALRLLLYRFAGLIGIAATALELLYYYLADDDIQMWLAYSALGRHKEEGKYSDYLLQRLAFEAIKELQNGKEIYDTLKQETVPNATVSHEEIMAQAEEMVARWVL